ncbi:MAG: CapA family protein, partial [Victivallales bacterium]|nr:CapA family protein [Victivallales bacterium]
DNIADLTKADVSITNLEVALCRDDQIDSAGVRGSRDLFHKMHDRAPFSIYSMANNHILDAGTDALLETIEDFGKRGVTFVGAGVNVADAVKIIQLDIKGIKVGIAAFAQNENQIATNNSPGAAELTRKNVLERSADLVRRVDVPVVIMHEGFEFMETPRFPQRCLCRKMIDLGVKVVFAHHPHVPQGIEKIDGSMIFHSLGNFLFAQPHFAPYLWTKRSFVPKLTFRGAEIAKIELNPFGLETEPCLFLKPADETVRREILERLRTDSEIVKNDDLMRTEIKKFFSDIHLPEYYGFIQRYGNDHDSDFSEMIERNSIQTPIRNLFRDYAEILADATDV